MTARDIDTNGRVVWSADVGWHDDGPRVTVGLDGRGRLTTRKDDDTTTADTTRSPIADDDEGRDN